MRLTPAALLLMGACHPDARLVPVTTVATQNAGTTPYLDALGESELRDDCDVWYCNDLCTTDAEDRLAATIGAQHPDVMLFQEIWDQRRCGDSERPPEKDEPPFACAGEGEHQLLRVLPEDMSFACADGERDSETCIAWRDAVFQPQDQAACDGRDCSGIIEVVQSSCMDEGRWALLRGEGAAGPTTLVVVHGATGAFTEVEDCSAVQIEAASQALEASQDDGLVLMGGDFNFDPDLAEDPQVEALAALVSTHGLERFSYEGSTHMIFQAQIDLLFSRGWEDAAGASCEILFVDEGQAEPMIDHGMVVCRQ